MRINSHSLILKIDTRREGERRPQPPELVTKTECRTHRQVRCDRSQGSDRCRVKFGARGPERSFFLLLSVLVCQLTAIRAHDSANALGKP